ncbi:dihydrolipoyl dehydrogenase [Pontibaca salina]|uniref:Dihydrolipoyl dehydrogenase n=1 Tax=Pontibaca salina TaxID=2795731 RepID=A0A934LZB4_9RHOB|nr:dihydrolipoyl dehydrogenase [Pontibaca salina]
MDPIETDLLVIGAGPGGYVCAIRAGQLGVSTVIVEKARPGGTCLNVGCIPSKALIHAADRFHIALEQSGDNPLGITVSEPRIDLGRTIAWKDEIVSRLTGGVAGLLKKAGVKTVQGQARFIDGKTVSVSTEMGEQRIHARRIVIATGARPVELPDLPFGGNILSSTEALTLTQVPESLVVVGAGYIGLEIGTAFAKLGARVTVVEAERRILPHYDADLTQPVANALDRLGVQVLLGARASGYSNGELAVATDEGEDRIPAAKVLVAVGRVPHLDDCGLNELSLAMTGRFLRIDDQCRTSMRGVFAIGDVTGEPMLAHRAMAQGVLVAEIAAGNARIWDKTCIPAICFTDPEIVTAGLGPDAAREAGHSIRTASFPLHANGRAMTLESTAGFVRVIAREDNNLILGLQAVGAGVSELSAQFANLIEMGARLEDVADTIHAHPSLSEAVQEAALAALGQALHI